MKKWFYDNGLAARMTMFLLAALYLFYLVVLSEYGGIGAYGLIVFAGFFLLIRALSRYREFAVDRGSAIITGQPSHLASALMAISGVMENVPSRDLRELEGMNAFFIIPAISGNSVMNLFSTHPTVEARIRALEKMERRMEL